MKNIKQFVLISSVIVGYSQLALSWGDMGHETIGEIAERNLTPQAAQTVTNILGADRLAIAATWPDSLRDDQDFSSFKNSHFYDIKTGQSVEDKQKNERKPDDAVAALERAYNLLKDRNVPRSVKMIALRFFVHIIGDLHQPLHVGNGLDFGGNLCFVMLNPPQISSLHSLWDGKFIEADIYNLRQKSANPNKFFNSTNYADDILQNSKLSTPEKMKMEEAPYQEWIKEAQDLRAFVYPDQAKTLAEEQARPYCKAAGQPGMIGPDKAVTLTDDYKKQAIQVTRRQLLAAGLRVASTLNKLFVKEGSAGSNKEMTQAAILKFFELK